MRKHLPSLFRICVSLVLIALIFVFLVDIRMVIQKMNQAHWPYLVIAALLMIAGTALRAVRWSILLQALEIQVPLSQLTYLYFVGAFFNLFLPTGMGGDAIKMAMLGKYTGRVPEAIGTTLVDRATGLWVLFVLAILALPFSYSLLPFTAVSAIAGISTVGVVGGFIVVGTPLLPWLGSKIRLPGQASLERFYSSVAKLGFPALGKACLISLIFNVMLIAFNILIALSLDVDLPLSVYILFTPIISLTLAIPISISGLGIREGAYITLFSSVGVPEETAVAMSLFSYLLTNLVVGILGGLLFAINSLHGIGKNQENSIG
jgi:uncharacterized membrane protein YbhN (UPF0104 family)